MPKELGDLVNLTELDLDNTKFTGVIPSEWCTLTNLKELKMNACGVWFQGGHLPEIPGCHFDFQL